MPGNIGGLNATGNLEPFEDLFVVGMRNYASTPMAFRAAGKAGITNFITGSVPLGTAQQAVTGAAGGHEDFYIDTYTAGRDLRSVDLLELMILIFTKNHASWIFINHYINDMYNFYFFWLLYIQNRCRWNTARW